MTNDQAKQLDELVSRYVEDSLQLAFVCELMEWLRKVEAKE